MAIIPPFNSYASVEGYKLTAIHGCQSFKVIGDKTEITDHAVYEKKLTVLNRLGVGTLALLGTLSVVPLFLEDSKIPSLWFQAINGIDRKIVESKRDSFDIKHEEELVAFRASLVPPVKPAPPSYDVVEEDVREIRPIRTSNSFFQMPLPSPVPLRKRAITPPVISEAATASKPALVVNPTRKTIKPFSRPLQKKKVTFQIQEAVSSTTTPPVPAVASEAKVNTVFATCMKLRGTADNMNGTYFSFIPHDVNEHFIRHMAYNDVEKSHFPGFPGYANRRLLPPVITQYIDAQNVYKKVLNLQNQREDKNSALNELSAIKKDNFTPIKLRQVIYAFVGGCYRNFVNKNTSCEMISQLGEGIHVRKVREYRFNDESVRLIIKKDNVTHDYEISYSLGFESIDILKFTRLGADIIPYEKIIFDDVLVSAIHELNS